MDPLDDSWAMSPAVVRPERTSQYSRSAPRSRFALSEPDTPVTAYSPIPLIRDAFASTAGRQRQAGSSLARSAQAQPSFDDDGLAGGYDERYGPDDEDATYDQGEISRLDLFGGGRPATSSGGGGAPFADESFNDTTMNVSMVMPERFDDGEDTGVRGL
jgi:hypothetical protein